MWMIFILLICECQRQKLSMLAEGQELSSTQAALLINRGWGGKIGGQLKGFVCVCASLVSKCFVFEVSEAGRLGWCVVSINVLELFAGILISAARSAGSLLCT